MEAALTASFATLTSVLSEEQVVRDPAACAGVAVDGLAPQCLVLPRSEQEVAAVLRFASEQKLGVIPCRNATKLGFGNTPRRYDIALSLKELNRVWRYEPDDLTVSVEPGMKLGDFQRFLARRGLWIPLDPPGGARASLGGTVAANAQGPLRLKYGAPRDMVLGMRVATTEGKIVKTGGRVVKNVAGYDLGKLLIGSYGTLGLIVEINFKLFPLPAHRTTWRLAAPNLSQAREFRRALLSSPLGPLRTVTMDSEAAALVSGHEHDQAQSYEIRVEFGGTETVIRRSGEMLQSMARALELSETTLDGASAEAAWDRVADFESALSSVFSRAVLVKASLPISAGEQFLELAELEAAKEGARTACLNHSGVGIVYVGLLTQEVRPSLGGVTNSLRKAARRLGGALVVLRSPAELKRDIDVWGPPGDAFDLMRRLKEAWDPQGVLSPGRFVGGL